MAGPRDPIHINIHIITISIMIVVASIVPCVVWQLEWNDVITFGRTAGNISVIISITSGLVNIVSIISPISIIISIISNII